MLDLQKLKQQSEELLIQIDDLLELFFSNQDVQILEKIPSILIKLSETTPRSLEKAHSQIQRFSTLLETRNYITFQDELLFFLSLIEQSTNENNALDNSSAAMTPCT